MTAPNSEWVRCFEEVWPQFSPERQRLLVIAITFVSEGQETLAIDLVEHEPGVRGEGPRADEVRR